jgi:hypothetical protein
LIILQTFTAKVLQSNYDIIIGRPTIKSFNLLDAFPSQVREKRVQEESSSRCYADESKVTQPTTTHLEETSSIDVDRADNNSVSIERVCAVRELESIQRQKDPYYDMIAEEMLNEDENLLDFQHVAMTNSSSSKVDNDADMKEINDMLSKVTIDGSPKLRSELRELCISNLLTFSRNH